MGTVRKLMGLRTLAMVIVCCSMALTGLMSPGQAAAYQGEQQMWGLKNYSEKAVIIVSRLDTGDVNANTAFVNQVTASFVRQSFGSDYRNIRSAGYADPVAGTTVVRRFTFTYEAIDGTLLVTDEWGPNIWMFMIVDETVRERELWAFISDTVIARYPSSIPSGYGLPEELDV